MKSTPKWLTAATLAVLCLSSCDNKNDKNGTTSTGSSATPPDQPASTSPSTPAQSAPKSVSVEQKAKYLGFLAHMPKDSCFAMGAFNLQNGFNYLSQSEKNPNSPASLLLKLLSFDQVYEDSGPAPAPNADPDKQNAEDPGDADAEVIKNMEADPEITTVEAEEMPATSQAGSDLAEARKFIGKSVTMSMGSNAPKNIKTGYDLTQSISKYSTYASLVSMLQDIAKKKTNPPAADTQTGFNSEEYIANEREMARQVLNLILKDQKNLTEIANHLELPLLILATECEQADATTFLDQFAEGIQDISGFTDGLVVPHEFEVESVKFQGLHIIGEKIKEVLNDEFPTEEMAEELGTEIPEEFRNSILDAVAKKNIYLAAGYVHGNLVFMLGSDKAKFALAKTVQESVVSNPDFTIVDSMINPDNGEIKETLYAAMYTNTEFSRSWYDAAKTPAGAFDALQAISETELAGQAFGDLRPMQALLKDYQNQASSFYDISSFGPAQILVTGTPKSFRVKATTKTLGASGIDFSKPLSTADLASAPGVFFYAGLRTDPKYTAKTAKMINTIGEIGYLGATYYAGSAAQADESFAQGFEMFNKVFKEDAYVIWNNISAALARGLGNEWTIVMDNAGKLPAYPMIPSQVVNSAHIPRVALIAEVQDRQVLSRSWDEIYASLGKIWLKTPLAEKMALPMPSSSEKDGRVNWFFQIPGNNDNFSPCLSITDKYAIAGTSPVFNNALFTALAKPSSSVKGGLLTLKTAPFADLALRNIDELEKNYDAIKQQIPNLGAVSPKQIKELRAAIQSLPSSFQGINATISQENGDTEVYEVEVKLN